MNLPKRSKKFGVGKEIGGAIYVHRDYAHLVVGKVKLKTILKLFPEISGYTILKFNYQTGGISFIEVSDFNKVEEPTVGVSWLIKDGTLKKINQPTDPWIYHHKWLMVADDYTGFSVKKSIERSQNWLKLLNIDFKRIGKFSYWQKMEHKIK